MSNKLFETLDYKELKGLIKPTVHIDEFQSKMGDDDDVIVLSFYVHNDLAADDLVNWFEKGYDFVLDADRSPGELEKNRYLVYVEIRRRTTAARNIESLLDDMSTLCEFSPEDWTFEFRSDDYAWDLDLFSRVVPLSPRAYRKLVDGELNEMRAAAGIKTKRIYDKDDRDLQRLQSGAGII